MKIYLIMLKINILPPLEHKTANGTQLYKILTGTEVLLSKGKPNIFRYIPNAYIFSQRKSQCQKLNVLILYCTLIG
jgi:hypothetical protein